jgi:hypothetical protein
VSLHSVGWFFMTATSALASIAAGLEGFYIASGCYFVCTAIAAYFCFDTAQEDDDE